MAASRFEAASPNPAARHLPLPSSFFILSLPPSMLFFYCPPKLGGAPHLLFVSSAYGGGSRMLQLRRTGDTVSVDERWNSQRVRIHFGNGVRLGNRLYASNGDMGSAPFAAIDVGTGDMLWRDRTVTRATLIASGDRLILLDEDGNLAIATPTDSGLQVHAKAPILTERAWTAPTLVGTTLYVRDRHQIMALDLSK